VNDDLIRVCAVTDVPPGTARAVEVNDTPLAIVHGEDGEFYAAYDECSHAQIPLSEGEIDGCTLECWLHGSRFDLRTGKPSGPPAIEPVPVYPIQISDGDVYVSLVPSNGVNP
jgi:3-phenylpropionate/trans-cinnamate dioxygenase ferredoxin subunit